MAVTLGIYYLLPWIRWNRGPSLPDQAVLLDFANQRLFFGRSRSGRRNSTTSPGCLILSALGLFLVTAVAGRMWCGYTCPQTVWTDLMIVVERFWQGDRNARIRLDKAPGRSRSSGRKRRRTSPGCWSPSPPAARSSSISAMPRRSPPSSSDFDAPMRSPTSSSASSRPPPISSAASRASRCASTCARGRASRARMFDRDSLLISYRG